tara:strand:- start:318 stop:587 length:270 start_codon:yes stop_codon:yes gene_type:complete
MPKYSKKKDRRTNDRSSSIPRDMPTTVMAKRAAAACRTSKASKKKKKTARLCAMCGRPMPSIGHARKNGAAHHGDWMGRKYHKKCFKRL